MEQTNSTIEQYQNKYFRQHEPGSYNDIGVGSDSNAYKLNEEGMRIYEDARDCLLVPFGLPELVVLLSSVIVELHDDVHVRSKLTRYRPDILGRLDFACEFANSMVDCVVTNCRIDVDSMMTILGLLNMSKSDSLKILELLLPTMVDDPFEYYAAARSNGLI